MSYLPVLSASAKYYKERAISGPQKLKRLTTRHRAILCMHLAGYRNFEVAQVMHIREASVSRIINDPLGQEFLQRRYNDTENEFQALFEKAIQTLRDGLGKDQAMKDRLRAADMYFKRRGDYKKAEEGKETAEDVIQRILQLNLQVNINK